MSITIKCVANMYFHYYYYIYFLILFYLLLSIIYLVLSLTYIVSPLRKKGEKELISSYQQISRSTIFSFPWEHVYIFIIQSHASIITVRNSWRFQILTYQITYSYRRIICNVSAQNKRIKVTSRNRDTFKSTDRFMTYTP